MTGGSLCSLCLCGESVGIRAVKIFAASVPRHASQPHERVEAEWPFVARSVSGHISTDAAEEIAAAEDVLGVAGGQRFDCRAELFFLHDLQAAGDVIRCVEAEVRLCYDAVRVVICPVIPTPDQAARPIAISQRSEMCDRGGSALDTA